jgi:hypothetical protein
MIRDVYPGSGFFYIPDPDPGVKKALDPGSGTLEKKKCKEKYLENITAKKEGERIASSVADPDPIGP